MCENLVIIVDLLGSNVRESVTNLTGHNKYSLSYKHSKLHEKSIISKDLQKIRDQILGFQQRQFFSPKQLLKRLQNGEYYRDHVDYYVKNHNDLISNDEITRNIKNYNKLGIKQNQYGLYYILAKNQGNNYFLDKISNCDKSFISNLVPSHIGNRSLLFMLGVPESEVHDLKNLTLEIHQIHDVGHRILNIMDEIAPSDDFKEIRSLFYPLRNEIYFPERDISSFLGRMTDTIITKGTQIRDLGIIQKDSTVEEVLDDLIDVSLRKDYLQNLPNLMPDYFFLKPNCNFKTISEIKEEDYNDYKKLFEYVKSEIISQKVNNYAYELVRKYMGSYKTRDQLYLKFVFDIINEIIVNNSQLADSIKETVLKQKEIIKMSMNEDFDDYINYVNSIIPIRNDRGDFIKGDSSKVGSHFDIKVGNYFDFQDTYNKVFDQLNSLKTKIPYLGKSKVIQDFLSIKFIPREIQKLYSDQDILSNSEIQEIMNKLGIYDTNTMNNWFSYFIEIVEKYDKNAYNINWFKEKIKITPDFTIQPPNYKGLKIDFSLDSNLDKIKN